jgi:radical SAM superfamily enzyme YgiQ (UPF0313 family)
VRILLVFPPQGHFTQPYLALPSLRAYLEAQGFDDVHVMDANIEAYEWLLTRERLGRALGSLESSDRFRRLETRESLRYTEMVEYRRLTQALAAGGWVIENIEAAKRVLRSPEFYDREKYLKAGRVIEQALALISAEHHPTDLSAHGFSMRHSVQVTDDIFAGAKDERENPFLEYFREVTLPKIEALRPDVVGLSVTFTSQLIPAVSLSSMIKRWNPDVHVTVGGGLIAYVGPKLLHRPDLFDTIDTLVRLEGERPLGEICHAVEKGAGQRGLAKIPNIFYRDETGAVRRTEEIAPLSIDALPTPSFEGLPLDLYFSPDFVIPLAITRGCYWGKCVFCTLYKVIGPGYRGRSIERVVEDIQALKERWESRTFYFPIEDLPPNMVRRLPSALLEAGVDIDWWCDAKLEPEVFTKATCEKLAEAGCKRLAFGYESASARVLDLMCKGSEPGPGMEVIHRVHEAGISVTLYVMVGFPTETEEEARLTLDTLLANREHFEEVSVRVFYLDEMSDMFGTPERYGITKIFPDERADLQVYYDFSTSSGMPRAHARRVYLEILKRLESHLPVFQNRNVLYHELKSHYFLYLAKAGSVKALLEGAFAHDSSGMGSSRGPSNGSRRSLLPEHPQSADLVLLPTSFDRDEVDRALDEAQDGLVLPRYQFDLISGDNAARLDRDVPALPRRAAALALDRGTGTIHCLSRDVLELLKACDGARKVSEIAERYEPEDRATVLAFLEELARGGLIRSEIPQEVEA